MSWTLEDLVGYINTWSAVKAAEKALSFNPVVPLEKALRKVWGDPGIRRRVSWTLSLRVGHVQPIGNNRC
jgi:hypothetical protein